MNRTVTPRTFNMLSYDGSFVSVIVRMAGDLVEELGSDDSTLRSMVMQAFFNATYSDREYMNITNAIADMGDYSELSTMARVSASDIRDMTSRSLSTGSVFDIQIDATELDSGTYTQLENVMKAISVDGANWSESPKSIDITVQMRSIVFIQNTCRLYGATIQPINVTSIRELGGDQ